MATFDTTRTSYGAATVVGQITRAAHNAITAVVVWNDIRMTRKALSSLTTRELEDIGLSRADLETFTCR